MWPSKDWRQRYEAVVTEDGEVKDRQAQNSLRKKDQRWLWIEIGLGCTLLLLSGFAYFGFAYSALYLRTSQALGSEHQASRLSNSSATKTSNCPRRREWRTLTVEEQQDYLSAILCLRTQPSALTPNSNKTAYDDFPWIHSHVGYYTHNSAPFLPWHRYFLHIYERTLRDRCGYQGSLVYWDWTLDSETLELSPVFDAATGFGGDGEIGGEVTVGRSGRCLVDGPFVGVTADYYDVKLQPHCLSRGFRDLEGNLGHIDGHDISPQSIEEVLSLDDYESFVALMESRVHDAIPFGIGGDFETFTAPYDVSLRVSSVGRPLTCL